MSNDEAIVFDTEFLTADGAQGRYWCGPFDPDPTVAQIGAVRLRLSAPFDIIDTVKIYVTPQDRFGNVTKLDPFFSKLTGVTQSDIDSQGKPLGEALDQFMMFSDGATMWSWGKDEHNLMAISCYLIGVAPPIPATRFGNACNLMLCAGMPYEDIKRTRSSGLAAYFGLADPDGQAHDGLSDALSITYALQHVLAAGRLSANDFDPRLPPKT